MWHCTFWLGAITRQFLETQMRQASVLKPSKYHRDISDHDKQYCGKASLIGIVLAILL
jgi:hypothetical protein